jgi:uncharacterized membrane protein YraQ (UPF0718 family)
MEFFEGPVFMWIAAIVAGTLVWFREPSMFRQGIQFAVNQFKQVLPVLFLAMFLASFLTTLIPEEMVARWLGEQAGIRGILLASLLGGFVPGGPMITFPVIVALVKMNVATPSVIAFLTAWGVYAIHRVVIFEVPMGGPRVATIRILSSLILPPLTGIIASWCIEAAKAFGL